MTASLSDDGSNKFILASPPAGNPSETFSPKW